MGYWDYSSLEKLPGTHRDQYGNLKAPQEAYPLRGRFEYALKLTPKELSGTVLGELLDWLRWGSDGGVMWEATLPELIQLIENWLAGNPDAPQELFSPHICCDEDWDELWNKRGVREEVQEARICKCGTVHRMYTFRIEDCQKCWQRWYEMESADWGPRGLDTYNLALVGAGGCSVAAAVWTNRNWLFVVPLEFAQKKFPYEYSFA